MPKISVIVPVYNVELYVGKCIDSLINQTINDIEIIVVNDGSTDRTREVVERKINKNKSKNIKLYDKENGGQSDARNFGLKMATGDYIAFVDGDDYVEKDMFEKLYKKVEEYPYDIVMCNVNCKYPQKDVEIKSGIKNDYKNMTDEDRKEIILKVYAVVWNKIYNKKLFSKDVQFEKGIWYEDVLFLYKIIPKLESVAVINEKLYNYVQRKKSVTYTYNEKLYDILKVLDLLERYYEENNLKQNYLDILEYVNVRYEFATFLKRLAKCKNKSKFDAGYDFVKDNIKNKYPNHKKNRFITSGGLKNFYLKHFNKFFADLIYIIEKNKMN